MGGIEGLLVILSLSPVVTLSEAKGPGFWAQDKLGEESNHFP